MEKVYYKKNSDWVRPWMTEQFDDLYNRDERYFSVLIKGLLGWLTKNIVLYNKPIKHFIFNTGSSYMYIENNGYEFSWNTTSGEDHMYMEKPRCVVEIGNINIPTEELTQPFVRAVYERKDGNTMKGFNGETRRLPIEMEFTLHYVLSNFNESIILMQELIDKLVFMKYFSIVYLGQTIKCSIEFPTSSNIQINKIDMASPDPTNKTIELSIKVASNYPLINDLTETDNSVVISQFTSDTSLYVDNVKNSTDVITKTNE